MKTILKFTICLVFFVASKTMANNVDDTILINKMIEDTNVKKYLINSLKLKFVGSGLGVDGYKNASDNDKKEFDEKFLYVMNKRSESIKAVYETFPQLENMQIEKRMEIFNAVMNSEKMAINVGQFLICLGGAIATIPVCLNAAKKIKEWAFIACASATVISTIVAEASEPVVLAAALDTGVEVAIVETEAQACAKLTFPSADVVGCITAFSVSLGVCLDYLGI